MIDHSLRRQIERFAEGAIVRNGFAGRVGPPVSMAMALFLGATPAAYWLHNSIGMVAALTVAAFMLIGGAAVVSSIRSYIVVLTDENLLVLDSRPWAPRRAVGVAKRLPADEADLVVRTSPWGFAQVHVDGDILEVASRDYTNAQAMGQLLSDGPTRFALN